LSFALRDEGLAVQLDEAQLRVHDPAAVKDRLAYRATVAQVAIAWVAARGDDIVALVGARRRDRLAESLQASSLVLTPDALARIEDAVPAGAGAGGRYADFLLHKLDSEHELDSQHELDSEHELDGEKAADSPRS